MQVVTALAIGALLALALAILTGSTVAAFAVVGLAGTGIALLLRDWRADRRSPPADPDPDPDPGQPSRPDEFAPDISADPDGPTSDARADQL